ncbi:uncharacterized protein DUF3775 [Breoghania corrubedonensis]|uniref:Uncharacterized protein DUF3775 n=1 Tax=Breoghania corrubedonensis TaxID=665038 RepID=A0A2T5V8T3_9HYPH|nr:DUF3775 domain-containing protein [Breoghania corrubedonensis]PTW60141.1 uncharacterized protein DUF3775 [Breoghania corrubedonensis]
MTRQRRLSISNRKLNDVIALARRSQPVTRLTSMGSEVPLGGSSANRTETRGAAPRDDALLHHIEAFDQRIQQDLLALAWFGREEAAAAEWEDFALDAKRAWTRATAAYLAAMPALGDYLEQATAILGMPRSDA